MLNKFRRYNTAAGLIDPGDAIICAVSGGADSMALLGCLLALREEYALTVSVLHCNHHLRPEADGDAAFVRDFCQARHIPFTCCDLDVTTQQRKTGQSLEDAARSLRYACFAQAIPWDAKIATAHNAQDNLETSLIRLVRGASPRGLSGIPPCRGRIIRPLLFATRSEILDFLQKQHIPHREDASNATDFCLRNRLRHHVVPRLTAENPALETAWLETARQLREEDAYLSDLAQVAILDARQGNGFSIARVQVLHPVLRARVLFGFLQAFGVRQPRREHVRQLEALLASQSASGRLSLPGVCLARNYDTIAPAAESAPAPAFAAVLQIPGVTPLPSLGLRIRCELAPAAENFEKIANNTTQIILNYAMIKGRALEVRPRQPGDVLRLSGGSRTLKRRMIDCKIPQAQRDRIPVLAMGETVLAAFGLGTDPAWQAQAGKPCLRVILVQEKEEHTHA